MLEILTICRYSPTPTPTQRYSIFFFFFFWLLIQLCVSCKSCLTWKTFQMKIGEIFSKLWKVSKFSFIVIMEFEPCDTAIAVRCQTSMSHGVLVVWRWQYFLYFSFVSCNEILQMLDFIYLFILFFLLFLFIYLFTYLFIYLFI